MKLFFRSVFQGLVGLQALSTQMEMTNATMACALLGAKYGYNSIPAYYTSDFMRTGL